MTLSAPIYKLKRRAKLLARDQGIPLHVALDRIAREEGFAGWSELSSRHVPAGASMDMLPRISDGDLILFAARPGQGKTRQAMRLLLEALRDGRRGIFFTLDYTDREVARLIGALNGEGRDSTAGLEVVTSNEICADVVIRHLADAPPGTVAVIDYLQILDQRRENPALCEQIAALQCFARSSGVILAFIAQIDRSFEGNAESLPGLQDISLPNPADLGLFTSACFLHGGKVRIQMLAGPQRQ